MSRETSGGGTETGTYDDQDRLLSYGTATYTYTADGALQTKTVGTAMTEYAYDALGNLRTVTLPDGTTLGYVIDPQSRRVGKTRQLVGQATPTLEQGFLYDDQLRVAAALDGAGNVVSRFVYGTRVNVAEYMVKGGVTYRLLTDHLGSPRLVINTADGSVAQRMDYDEFGRVLTDTNPGFQPFGFAGGLYDRDTGLVRFGARDYDPITGRWTAKEPLGFAGRSANLYGYALSDPLNLIDVDGGFAQIAGGIVGGFVGGAITGAITSVVSTLATGGSWEDAFNQAAIGAVAGGLVGAAYGGLAAAGFPVLDPSFGYYFTRGLVIGEERALFSLPSTIAALLASTLGPSVSECE